jgi:hypothetical protein
VSTLYEAAKKYVAAIDAAEANPKADSDADVELAFDNMLTVLGIVLQQRGFPKP